MSQTLIKLDLSFRQFNYHIFFAIIFKIYMEFIIYVLDNIFVYNLLEILGHRSCFQVKKVKFTKTFDTISLSKLLPPPEVGSIARYTLVLN